MPRVLSRQMLKRKIKRWGYYNKNTIIIVYDNDKIALVYKDGMYKSVKAWNPRNRTFYIAHAKNQANVTLQELLAKLGWQHDR